MGINLRDKSRESMQNRRQGGGGHVADLVAQVKEIDPKGNVVHAVLAEDSYPVMEGYPKEISLTMNRNLEVKENRQAEWQGDIISDGMAEAFDEGETFIAKNVILPADKESTNPYPMDRVVNIPASNPDKVFEGTFTTSGFVKTAADERGNRKAVTDDQGAPIFVTNQLQVWPKRGMTPEDFLNDGMKDAYDQVVADFEERQKMRADGVEPKDMPPVKGGLGVSIRILNQDGSLDYQMSPMSTYAVESEEGGARSYAHVTYEDIEATVKELQGDLKDGQRIEVLPVKTFPIAPSIGDPTNENYKPFPGIEKPRYMALASARESLSEDRPTRGNSMKAVRGVASLQGGKLDKKGNRQGAENERVSQLYVNARKYHVSELVADSEGNEVIVPDEMKSDLLERNVLGSRQENAASQGNDSGAESEADQGGESPSSDEEDAMLDDAVNARNSQSAAPGN